MSTNIKHVRILKDHTLILKKNKQGVSRAEKDFKAGPDAIPVPRAQYDALMAATGVAEDAPAPTAEADPTEGGTQTANAGSSKSAPAGDAKK